MKNLYLKLAYRYEDVKKCLKGKTPIPLSATIFPSERCNLHCVYCHSESIHDGGQMSWDTYKSVIDDLKLFGVESVAFEGGGEPLLNPLMGKFITYAKGKGLGVGILTNGTIYIDELLLADWIRISLDVPNKEIFNEIKVPSDPECFDKILGNIATLVQNKSKTTIGIKFMLSKWWTDREACKKLCRDLGVDYCQVKYVRHHKLSLMDDRARAGEACKLTPLKVVINYDGSLHLCPFFHHQPQMKIGDGLLSELWGSEQHKKAISCIDPKKCAYYDCPMRNIDFQRLEDAHLSWV